MSRKARKGFTEIESNILRLLWEENKPLSCNEILNMLPTHDFHPASLYKVLNGMVDHGFLTVEGKYNKTYQAALSSEEYATAQFIHLTPNLSPSERINGLVSCFLHTEKLDNDAIDKLEKLLQDYREENNLS